MSPAHDSPTHEGAVSHESQPQVIVRAGKTFVCLACGTLVEIPAEFVDQFELVPAAAAPATSHQPYSNGPSSKDASPEKPIPPETPQAKEPPATKPPSPTAVDDVPSPKRRKPSFQPKHNQKLPRLSFAGQQIDGLTVPTAGQFDRAFAWVSYQLKILDRKHTEFAGLKKLLRKQKKTQAPSPRPRGPTKPATSPVSSESDGPAKPRHAHQDVSMVPGKMRGPDKKHAQADLGVAPEVDRETERGPP